MVRVRLLCSEARCAAVVEAIAPAAEIESLACECGCGLALLGWPEPLDGYAGRTEITLELLGA